MKWDIDWAKLGHPEPKAKKTTYPQGGAVSDSFEKHIGSRSSVQAILDVPEKPKAEQPKKLRPVGAPGETKPKVVNIAKPKPPVLNENHENDKKNENKEVNEMLASKEKLSDTSVGVSSQKHVNKRPVEKLRNDSPRRRGRDLSSGMELLELDFLLSVIEKTQGEEKIDITMRKLNFNELIRRQQLHEIDSSALKIYAIDEKGHYGRDIQCEALKELAERTASNK